MALKTFRQRVCDLGDTHPGEVTSWRITHERRTKTVDLCPGCASGIKTVWETGAQPRKRNRVVTMEEIEQQKNAT